MKVVRLSDLFKCETCARNPTGQCSPSVWCENGEQYRPDFSKIKILNVDDPTEDWNEEK